MAIHREPRVREAPPLQAPTARPIPAWGNPGSPASLLAGVDRPRKQAAPQALPLCRRPERRRSRSDWIAFFPPPQPSPLGTP